MRVLFFHKSSFHDQKHHGLSLKKNHADIRVKVGASGWRLVHHFYRSTGQHNLQKSRRPIKKWGGLMKRMTVTIILSCLILVNNKALWRISEVRWQPSKNLPACLCLVKTLIKNPTTCFLRRTYGATKTLTGICKSSVGWTSKNMRNSRMVIIRICETSSIVEHPKSPPKSQERCQHTSKCTHHCQTAVFVKQRSFTQNPSLRNLCEYLDYIMKPDKKLTHLKINQEHHEVPLFSLSFFLCFFATFSARELENRCLSLGKITALVEFMPHPGATIHKSPRRNLPSKWPKTSFSFWKKGGHHKREFLGKKINGTKLHCIVAVHKFEGSYLWPWHILVKSGAHVEYIYAIWMAAWRSWVFFSNGK